MEGKLYYVFQNASGILLPKLLTESRTYSIKLFCLVLKNVFGNPLEAAYK